MAGKRGKDGDCPPSQPFSAAGLPSWLDPDGKHGQMTVMIMKPATEGGSLPSNPFTIAKSIQATVGTIAEAYRDRDQNLVLKVRGETKAEKLKRMTKLIDGTRVTVAEHSRLNLTKVVVTCHSVSKMSDEELKAEPALQEQGVVDVRRFRKGGPTMTLTIRGTVAPEAIFFGYDRCRTKPFTQAPLQCFRCFEFGHPKIRCPAEEVCRNCSEAHPIIKDDEGKTICKKPPRCRNCNGPHSPTTRECPVYKQEEEIEKIRATGKSAREARRIYDEERKKTTDSYAGVVNTSVQNRLEIARKENEKALAAMRKELEAAKKENEDLRQKESAAAQKKDETRKLEKRLASYERKLQRARAEIEDLKAKEEQRKNEEEAEEDEEEMDEDEEEEEEEDEEEEEEEEEEDEVVEVPCPEPTKRRRSGSSEESKGSQNANNKINDKINEKTTNNKNSNKNTDKSTDWQKVPVNQHKRGKH